MHISVVLCGSVYKVTCTFWWYFVVVFTMKHRGQVMPFSLRDHIFRLGAMAPRDLPHQEFDLLVKKMTGKIRE